MAIISLIAAMDENNGLGIGNKLLCHLPADLNHFKTQTLGKPIIMGRKTFESIGRALPGRHNIVLSTTMSIRADITVVASLEQALLLTADVPEVMIIGGANLFVQALPLASRLYLTLIHHQFEADVFFPSIDRTHWHCTDAQFLPHDEKNKFDLTFFQYDKISI